MRPTIPRRNIFCEAMWESMLAAIGHEIMIVNGKMRMYFGPFSCAASHPAEFHLSSGTRELVAHFWILRGNDCIVRVCRSGENCLAFVAASSTRWHNWLGNVCLVGFGLGSPLLLFWAICRSTTKQSSGDWPGLSLRSILLAISNS